MKTIWSIYCTRHTVNDGDVFRPCVLATISNNNLCLQLKGVLKKDKEDKFYTC